MVDTANQVIGKYEILEKLGEGGFGIVYKANDTSLDRIVAIKQLKVELSSSPEYLERFKREARLMGSLNHPNIVKMLEVFEDAGRNFIVMDYMPNGSLADKLRDGKPLTLERTVEILDPIAKAIDYAHSKNLIHRDIKPSNILFMEGDEPVLSDFGLVKSMESTGLTTTGVTFGTPEYMSPEQILGKELTPAVDLYALGIVAYQMLCGEVPFKGNTPFEIQEGHVHKDLPAITQLIPAFLEDIDEVFAVILAKKPDERYGSAKEFVQDLAMQIDQKNTSQNNEKLKLVQQKMSKKDFATASDLLQDMIDFRPTDELKDLLNETQRKAKIWKEYHDLEDQSMEINKKLCEYEKNEVWIKENNESMLDLSESEEDDPNDDEEPKEKNWKPFGWITGWTVIICIFVGIYAAEQFSGFAIVGVLVILVSLLATISA